MKTKFNVIARCADGDLIIGKDGINEFDWDEANEIADAHKFDGVEVMVVEAPSKMIIKEFIKEYCTENDDNGYLILENTESEDGIINNYAGMFLDDKKETVFNALTNVNNINFSIDYVDFTDDDNTLVEIRCNEGWTREYTEDTPMSKVFEDCLEVLLNGVAKNPSLTTIINEYLNKTEL